MMKTDLQKPVIFLAFANDKEDNARYLRNLTKELHEIEDALKPIRDAYEIVHYQGITLEILLDKFQQYKDRIAIFHFGGHADGYKLLLQSEKGGNQIAFGEGLLQFLAIYKDSLKLVFFNGCATEGLAKNLVEVGLPAAIGTNSSINDDVATRLAIRFYNGLATQHTLSQSWQQAAGEIAATYDLTAGTRELFRKGETKEEQFAWEIKFAKEEFKNWKLEKFGNHSFNLELGTGNKNNENSNQNMVDFEKIAKWLEFEEYSNIFEELDKIYEKISDKSTYNRLKREHTRGMKTLDYDDRMKTFVNALKEKK